MEEGRRRAQSRSVGEGYETQSSVGKCVYPGARAASKRMMAVAWGRLFSLGIVIDSFVSSRLMQGLSSRMLPILSMTTCHLGCYFCCHFGCYIYHIGHFGDQNFVSSW